jgi:hypothetical protein
MIVLILELFHKSNPIGVVDGFCLTVPHFLLCARVVGLASLLASGIPLVGVMAFVLEPVICCGSAGTENKFAGHQFTWHLLG